MSPESPRSETGHRLGCGPPGLREFKPNGGSDAGSKASSRVIASYVRFAQYRLRRSNRSPEPVEGPPFFKTWTAERLDCQAPFDWAQGRPVGRSQWPRFTTRSRGLLPNDWL